MLKRTWVIVLLGYVILPWISQAAVLPTQSARLIGSSTANQSTAQPQTLSQQVNGLLAAAQTSQQQLQTRLVQLNQQDNNLQQQLVLAQSQLTLLSRRIGSLPAATLPQNHDFFSLQNPLINSHLSVGLLALGFLLLVWLVWYRLPTVKIKAEQQAEDEYDFMGSEEALPAKLALARAYIEMGNETEARSALAEVVAKGNNAQREEALQLLKELPIK